MIFYSTKIVILEKSSTFFKVLKFLEPSTMSFDIILYFSGELFSFQKFQFFFLFFFCFFFFFLGVDYSWSTNYLIYFIEFIF